MMTRMVLDVSETPSETKNAELHGVSGPHALAGAPGVCTDRRVRSSPSQK